MHVSVPISAPCRNVLIPLTLHGDEGDERASGFLRVPLLALDGSLGLGDGWGALLSP